MKRAVVIAFLLLSGCECSGKPTPASRSAPPPASAPSDLDASAHPFAGAPEAAELDGEVARAGLVMSVPRGWRSGGEDAAWTLHPDGHAGVWIRSAPHEVLTDLGAWDQAIDQGTVGYLDKRFGPPVKARVGSAALAARIRRGRAQVRKRGDGCLEREPPPHCLHPVELWSLAIARGEQAFVVSVRIDDAAARGPAVAAIRSLRFPETPAP